ncbi:jg9783 [Pararge aegeria aegeria]|uniref:Jg9783 protein n=1 Tax=Pararge aegeria aegeria TaxID=348720 RepID=A0A8S4RJP2_9NEOP|nr:jg9783 [Pararge aegeria aegeria]
MSYLAGGMAITVRGRQVSRKEAPILVVAPHSSFLDSCIVYATKMSSVIVRKESMDNYVGKLINYTQPVYVWRDDPNSRQNTIKEIIERATSKEDWPQVLIFPEGTCTNRSCLITFKPGGFYPGVPVQPVTIRYPNARDTVTWTWDGPGALKLLWLTLTQVHSSCEIEFLPVYYPNEDEKQDPKLYARNVRDVMAKALGVPVLDYTYDDCRLIAQAKQMGIPGGVAVREVSELRTLLGLTRTRVEMDLARQCIQEERRWVSGQEFAQRLGVPYDTRSQRLYKIFENLYDPVGAGRLKMHNFEEVATRCLGLAHEEAQNTFQQVDEDDKGYITYDDFMSFFQNKSDFSLSFVEVPVKPKAQ